MHIQTYTVRHKKDGIFTFVTAYTKLEIIMLIELSIAEKGKSCNVLLMWNKTNKQKDLVEVKNKMGLTQN